MSNEQRTIAALQTEIAGLRQRVAELEQANARLTGQETGATATPWCAPVERTPEDTTRPPPLSSTPDEDNLIESDRRYRTLVETSPDAILLTDLDSTIRFCNQQAVTLFGYPNRETLSGIRGDDLVAVAREFKPLTYSQMSSESSTVRQREYTMRRRDGSWFPAEINSSVIHNAQGEPTALIIVVRDISERKMTEDALTTAYNDVSILNEHLARSRNLLRLLFDGLRDGFLLLDGSGKVQAINRSLATLLGSKPQAMVGQLWETLYQRIAPDFPGHMVMALANSSADQTRRIRYHTPDGVTRILDIQTIALHNSENALEQVILHVIDVTHQAQFHERMIENERFAAGGRLAAIVAHEINTPLQALKNSLYLVEVAPADERATFLEYAREEVRRIGTIANQLLDLYRTGTATPGDVDINMLLDRILLLIGKRIKDQSVVVERHFAEQLPRCRGRADELTQVLLNLLVNALDAMQEGGTLQLYTGSHEAGIYAAISDNGHGIAPELQTRIFEPFVTTREDGTGLGLAISNEIMQQHGGKISLKSTPGVGSTFTITLPTGKPADAEATASE